MSHDDGDARSRLGARDRQAFAPYEPIITSAVKENRLQDFIPVYSREDQQRYVQDQLAENASEIAENLKTGGVIMICGSVFMQQAVLALLTEICKNHQLKL